MVPTDFLTASQTLDFALRPAVVSTPTITIGANGVVSPSQITISVGQQVLFVNSHTAAHDVESDPHPVHTQCPAINIGLLAPGQSRLSAPLTIATTCGFHDHQQPLDTSLQGTIIVR